MVFRKIFFVASVVLSKLKPRTPLTLCHLVGVEYPTEWGLKNVKFDWDTRYFLEIEKGDLDLEFFLDFHWS